MQETCHMLSKGKIKGMARPAAVVKKILKRPAAVAASSSAGGMSEGDTMIAGTPC